MQLRREDISIDKPYNVEETASSLCGELKKPGSDSFCPNVLAELLSQENLTKFWLNGAGFTFFKAAWKPPGCKRSFNS